MDRKFIVLQLCLISIGLISSEDSWPLYRISTVLHEPWVMKNGAGYRGFIVDLLDELSNKTQFHYKLQPTVPGRHDNVDYVHGQYDSIVHDVQKKIADIGAADVMVTEERLQRVSFSRPFISTGAQLIIRKPILQERRTFITALAPFRLAVWVMLVVCLILVVVLLCVIERVMQTSSKDNPRSATFANSVLVVFGTVCFQGYRKISPSISRSILLLFWCVFILLILLTYAANLTSLYVHSESGKPVLPFKTFTQLAHQSDVTYGGWFGMPLNPSDTTQFIMERFISSRFSYYTNTEEAVARVQNPDQPFAAILSGTEGIYLSNRHCDLMLLREQLFPIDYAIVCPYGMDGERLCGDITMSLLALRESGFLEELMHKWWAFGERCPVTREDEFRTGPVSGGHGGYRPVVPMELGFAFSVLLLGLIVSGVTLMIEAYRRKKQKQKSDTISSQENNTTATEQPMLAKDVDAEDGDTARHITMNDQTV